ncbi:hypothetical protein [Halalkalibacter akibai]|nr:hypothetical protein [Halalkalibacter akibai]
MTYEMLLERLNNTPIKINPNLLNICIKNCKSTIENAEEFIRNEMISKGVKANTNFMSDSSIINYCNKFLISRYNHNKPYTLEDKARINLNHLAEHFQGESFVIAYIEYRKWLLLKKKYEAILQHERDGSIQPKFAINSVGNVYTSKPSLTLPHQFLNSIFDCKSHHFNTIEEAMTAMDNAKESSEIITVINKTVYYRNENYEKEKEIDRQAFIKQVEDGVNDNLLLFLFEEWEYELEFYNLNHLPELHS